MDTDKFQSDVLSSDLLQSHAEALDELTVINMTIFYQV